MNSQTSPVSLPQKLISSRPNPMKKLGENPSGSTDMCFSGPIPIITDQVNRYFEPIYVSGVKMKMNAKINNNKSSDKKTFFKYF